VHEKDSRPSRWNPNPAKKDPPCGTCRPGIHNWNLESVSLYCRVSGQWAYHPVAGYAVALPTTEINAEMDALCVPRTEWAERLDEVRELAGMILRCWQRERERLKEQNG
jgi:hypothetical protein